MSNPVSVIIPCHEQDQWVEAAILSAHFQSDDVTVIFNGKRSKDIYAPGINEYHVGIEFRTGVCYNRNCGVDGAIRDLILPLDADDQLYPDAIERLYAAWQPGTFVYGNHTEVTEDGQVIREVEAPPAGMLPIKNLTYATFLFHKDDWQRVGGYDPTFELGCEDYAFQIALAANGVRPVKLEGAPIYRRMVHPQSRTSTAIEHFPMLQRLMKRKWPSAFPNH